MAAGSAVAARRPGRSRWANHRRNRGLVGSVTDGLGEPSALDDPLDPGSALGESDDRADQEPGEPDSPTSRTTKTRTRPATKTATRPRTSTPHPIRALTPCRTMPPQVPGRRSHSPPSDRRRRRIAARPTGALPTPPLAPPPEGSTPCEIAADELPQAGQ
ncbi:hypothetical protein I552_8825 [Mycobacterium xenopi 3993]|nr:hypothetical protein I552_8825 [Mycobacterium xenopi 3993]